MIDFGHKVTDLEVDVGPELLKAMRAEWEDSLRHFGELLS